MKKLIAGALATAMIASPLATSVASAQDYGRRTVTTVKQRPNGRTVVTQRTVQRNAGHGWQRGQRFDRRHATNYREIDYRQFRGRHLYAPPRGYHWVRSGNDAVLVAVSSGIIGAVLAGALRWSRAKPIGGLAFRREPAMDARAGAGSITSRPLAV